ncbi:MAG: aspartate carbamoyltransferase catalytic subunit [Candidatus Omnitrophota bacterium]
MKWQRKDLLGLEEISAEEIDFILQTAASFKEVSTREVKKVPALRGKTVANLFFEPSTRTRTSFELAAKRLSADIVNFSPNTSSVVKGETILDTGENLEAMKIDCFVVRHPSSGVPALLAKKVKAAVINAGDGNHEHPTQALLDLFTIKERKKRIKGLKVVILGDICHSRVARSNLWGLMKSGARVVFCGPPTLIPQGIEDTGAIVIHHLKEALKDADVINILRIQTERQKENYFPSLREYSQCYQINRETIRWAKPDVLIMHPGPMNRGIEITSEIAEDAHSVILPQVENGLAVRMAVLYLLLVGK